MSTDIEQQRMVWRLQGYIDITGLTHDQIFQVVIPELMNNGCIRRINDLNYSAIKPFSMVMGNAKKTFIRGERIFANNLWCDALSWRMHSTHKYCSIFRTKESLDI